MIHEEKWYTCDRCGERIENLVEDVLDCLPEEVSAQIPRDDYLKINERRIGYFYRKCGI